MSRLLQRTIVIAFVAILVGPLGAADDKPPVKSAEAVKPVEVRAVFHDGTIIHKAVLQDAVEITTKYGKLTIPAADIRRIEFGLHTDNEAAKKVEDLIKALGSDDFAQRDEASKDLVKLGVVAYTALEHAVKSPDKEVATRAKAALDSIRASVPAERLNMKAEDVVTTQDCVLTGKISGTVLKAQTETFGELQFKMAQLAMIQSGADLEKKPGTPGNPYQTGAGPGGFVPGGPFPGPGRPLPPGAPNPMFIPGGGLAPLPIPGTAPNTPTEK